MNLKLLALVFLIPFFRDASSFAAVPETPSEARLVSSVSAHGGEPILAGIVLKLEQGWKTYWRNPGDSGIPPSFDWSGSQNLKSIELRWPAPKRFDLEAETIFGYENEVTFPLLLRAENPTKALRLELKLSYAVCSTLCVPVNTKIEIDIPAGRPKLSEDATMLQQALSRVPLAPHDPSRIKVALAKTPKLRLMVECAECATSSSIPDLIVDGPSGSWFGKASSRRKAGLIVYEAPIELDPGISLKGQIVNLVFVGGDSAIEIERHLP